MQLIFPLQAIVILVMINRSTCSPGDRLSHYRKCNSECLQVNCSNAYALEEFDKNQPLYLKLLAWDCFEECRYQCQWSTVQHLVKLKVPVNQVPQFHGKWTFKRFLGIQEPASAIFSLLNFCTNLYGWRWYRQAAVDDPFKVVWTIQAILAMNAWICSVIFHIHDIPFTEKLDYFSAYSVVLYSLCAVTIRVIDDLTTKRSWIMPITVAFVSFYSYHIYFLFFIRFDYGYNLKVNLITGILSSFGWIIWSYKMWSRAKHVWKCILTVFLLNFLLIFELIDFPPIFFILDAHSLWHLGTVPIPLIWYSFLIDDSRQKSPKLVCD